MAARAGRFATRSGALRSASRAPSYTTTRDVTLTEDGPPPCSFSGRGQGRGAAAA
jgi:hypothetical protein